MHLADQIVIEDRPLVLALQAVRLTFSNAWYAAKLMVLDLMLAAIERLAPNRI